MQIPEKLEEGSVVSVIAPSRSLSIVSEEIQSAATKNLNTIGLSIRVGNNAKKIDWASSSSISERVEDFHHSFKSKNVNAVLTAIGGYNSNQLLRYLDWKLIKKNPKIFCGYSDITALSNALYAKTGMVTYLGPHFSTFGQKTNIDYTMDYFRRCLFSSAPFTVAASKYWTDDRWYAGESVRLRENLGFDVINAGDCNGVMIGGNLSTFCLLLGTEYLPSLNKSVLVIEDTHEVKPAEFDRFLQSLIHQPDFAGVNGILFGRPQIRSGITLEILRKIIGAKKELCSLPIIAGLDFGHTDPKITLPIGGTIEIQSEKKNAQLTVNRH